jgi:acetyl-CoA carboxylase biotin carboxyl carrier protein
MTEPGNSERVLSQLREQARQLVEEVGGPLRRLRIRSGDATLEVEWHGAEPAPQAPVTVAAVEPAPLATPHGHAPDPVDWIAVVSPIVGTFYRAPEPGAANFVEVGDLVEAGQVIGIVEAMKLMNHIVAERAGKVSEVLVGNGVPVEFEQPLIALVPV